uniref:LAGLIDADG homing endonuclease n=1 Tax=Phanerochaete carnosa TaxID=231932 RepID=A0A895KU59_9APHY|nr:LAGLIDADG homing endonuclease [Phanerochaete carnosa]QRZ60349.1 LAGLIDADG homing endonuclease [Phanerochaete carnosa]
MNLGLSEVLKAAFPFCKPVARPQIFINKNYHPQWVAGFTSGEGYFAVKILESSTHKTGFQVKLIFQLTQHSRDDCLMKSFEGYFGCGKYYSAERADYGDFQVGKFSDIIEKIIPFFQNYVIRGEKAKDFYDWCKVADIMKDKQHLTVNGLEQIREIKALMNKARY